MKMPPPPCYGRVREQGGGISISRTTCKGGTLCITSAGRRPGKFLGFGTRNVLGNIDFQCKNCDFWWYFLKISACGGHTFIKYNFILCFLHFPFVFFKFWNEKLKKYFFILFLNRKNSFWNVQKWRFSLSKPAAGRKKSFFFHRNTPDEPKFSSQQTPPPLFRNTRKQGGGSG